MPGSNASWIENEPTSMDEVAWEHVKELFHRAMTCGPKEREGLLRAQSTAVRLEVEELLKAHARATPENPEPATSAAPQGVAITEYCDEASLSIPARLKLFEQVCLVVHRAHQRGILHLDIRPFTVRITRTEGCAVPRLVDSEASSTEARVERNRDYSAPEEIDMSDLDIRMHRARFRETVRAA